MMEHKKQGFATNPKLASESGRKAKARQSPEERSQRASEAAKVKWAKYREDRSNENK
jgi:hypothetical protein